MTSPIKIAVVGNPNSGKSTLINNIAGSRLKVGNWSGVTVEKKEAKLNFKNKEINLVDLPGIYSLSPYSIEEKIARDFLINEQYDAILNVIDSTNIERSFYLTIQLLELGVPIIIVFNIYDEAKTKGIEVDLNIVSKLLNVQATSTVATKKEGINELLNKIISIRQDKKPKDISYGQDLDRVLDGLTISGKKIFKKFNLSQKFIKLKILEGSADFIEQKDLSELKIDDITAHLKEFHNQDLEEYISEARHSLARGFAMQITKVKEKNDWDISRKIDQILLNRYLSLPIFLMTMWLIFKLTFDIANPFIDFLDGFFGSFLAKWASLGLNFINSPQWFNSLLVDGIIGGVGFVLVFTPVIFTMMFFITFIESSGYMARVAFITDRIMRSFGLHGKSFVPLLIGFGCNVPAIYATRTLESFKDRVATSMVIPFMSCGARLPVYILFTSAFFAQNPSLVIWSLYILGIIIAAIVSVILQKTIFKQEAPLFVMELPPYRLPSFKSLMIHTWEKGKHFLIKAGTYILAVSIFVWFLLNLPWGVEDKKNSYLGQAGQIVAPIFKPLGFGDWQSASSLITGIVAKEIIIGTMGQIYASEIDSQEDLENDIFQDLSVQAKNLSLAFVNSITNVLSTISIVSISLEEDESNSSLKEKLQLFFTPLSAFSFMVFTLLYMPCVVTGIAMKQEFGSWKWFGLATIIGFVVAWLLSFLTYNIGLWVL